MHWPLVTLLLLLSAYMTAHGIVVILYYSKCPRLHKLLLCVPQEEGHGGHSRICTNLPLTYHAEGQEQLPTTCLQKACP